MALKSCAEARQSPIQKAPSPPSPVRQRSARDPGTATWTDSELRGGSWQKVASTAGVNSFPPLRLKQIFFFFLPLDDAVLNRLLLSCLPELSAGERCRFVGGLYNLQSIWRDFLTGQNTGLAHYKHREIANVRKGGGV